MKKQFRKRTPDEKSIEAKFRDGVKELGGLCYKFTSPGSVGVPDRIVIMPGGRVYFVELKKDKGRRTKMQTLRQTELRAHGARVWTLFGLVDVKAFLVELRRELFGDAV